MFRLEYQAQQSLNLIVSADSRLSVAVEKPRIVGPSTFELKSKLNESVLKLFGFCNFLACHPEDDAAGRGVLLHVFSLRTSRNFCFSFASCRRSSCHRRSSPSSSSASILLAIRSECCRRGRMRLWMSILFELVGRMEWCCGWQRGCFLRRECHKTWVRARECPP